MHLFMRVRSRGGGEGGEGTQMVISCGSSGLTPGNLHGIESVPGLRTFGRAKQKSQDPPRMLRMERGGMDWLRVSMVL